MFFCLFVWLVGLVCFGFGLVFLVLVWFLVLVCLVGWFGVFKTGFLCIALAVLELTL